MLYSQWMSKGRGRIVYHGLNVGRVPLILGSFNLVTIHFCFCTVTACQRYEDNPKFYQLSPPLKLELESSATLLGIFTRRFTIFNLYDSGVSSCYQFISMQCSTNAHACLHNVPQKINFTEHVEPLCYSFSVSSSGSHLCYLS